VWFAKQIVKSYFEAVDLNIDPKGEIIDIITYGSSPGTDVIRKTATTISDFQKNLARSISSGYVSSSLLSSLRISSPNISDINKQTATEQFTHVSDAINLIEKSIISSDKDTVWP